ncbi:MAG: formate--tetrahydrofolate ligase, partial [Hyphomicrobiales bacterium]|nr:formate--tetrahydrofolate ligase [Hyphomicrobiales bacterium]
EDLAHKVVGICDSGQAQFKPLYGDDVPLKEKVRTIAQQIYGAEDIAADKTVEARFAQLEDEGYGHFPVCMAKTQYSFSTDPNLKGAPEGHTVAIRELRLSAGAEFIVAITGDIMTMPGLPRTPAANAIHLDDQGQIQGLF